MTVRINAALFFSYLVLFASTYFGICLGAENYRMSYHLFAVYISLIGKHWLEIFSQIERINGDMRCADM